MPVGLEGTKILVCSMVMDSIDFGYRPNLKATNIATTAFRGRILNNPLRDTGSNDMTNRFNDLLNIFFIRYIQLILKKTANQLVDDGAIF